MERRLVGRWVKELLCEASDDKWGKRGWDERWLESDIFNYSIQNQ